MPLSLPIEYSITGRSDLGDRLAHDLDALRLEPLQVAELAGGRLHGGHGASSWMAASTFGARSGRHTRRSGSHGLGWL